MRRVLFVITLFLTSLISFGQQDDLSNLDFESTETLNEFSGWALTTGENVTYSLDKEVKQDGHQSLRVTRKDGNIRFANCRREIDIQPDIAQVTLTGYLKTLNVVNGWVSFWLRIDDMYGNMLYLYNGAENKIEGNSEWKKYRISVDIKLKEPAKCYFGIILTGTGSAWADNMSLLRLAGEKKTDNLIGLDLINKASVALDSEFKQAQTTYISTICKVWGFLKYYHPNIGLRNYNWDSVLFKLIPVALTSKSTANTNEILEGLINQLGELKAYDSCQGLTFGNAKFDPFNDILNDTVISDSLKSKLNFIRISHTASFPNRYVKLDSNLGSPIIINELEYSHNPFPESALRLLSVARYWNIVEYLYPYRYKLVNWDKVLSDYIARFQGVENKSEYLLACLELFGNIHDTHGSIFSNNALLDSLKGEYILPINAKFLGDTLVVKELRLDSFPGSDQILPGDIIEEIDGVTVDSLKSKLIRFTPASNYSEQLFLMPASQGFLLRSNKIRATLTLRREEKKWTTVVMRYNIYDKSLKEEHLLDINKSSYFLINKEIGYINPSKLTDGDFEPLKRLFLKTRGIIIDLRCYPSNFMPFVYGSWLKSYSSIFARLSVNNPSRLGQFQMSKSFSNGGSNSLGSSFYGGKVILIVNSATMSRGEYTAMALSSSKNTFVIGSQTAGADGDIAKFSLPGNIQTAITGTGVYYPDFSETQNVGVKINLLISPTSKGIRQGKDELLDKAVEIIDN